MKNLLPNLTYFKRYKLFIRRSIYYRCSFPRMVLFCGWKLIAKPSETCAAGFANSQAWNLYIKFVWGEFSWSNLRDYLRSFWRIRCIYSLISFIVMNNKGLPRIRKDKIWHVEISLDLLHSDEMRDTRENILICHRMSWTKCRDETISRTLYNCVKNLLFNELYWK